MAVVIETTLGDVTVDLFTEQRPLTCLNFLKLCKVKYYNFNLFHTIQHGFIAQTGDPTGEGTGGQSIWGVVDGPDKRYFEGEKMPRIKHTEPGLLSMVATEEGMIGSQFFFTLASDLNSLDAQHCVIGAVTEGHDVLRQMNETICDGSHRPYQDVRITHTVVLEDPFNNPKGLREPSRSPSPSAERLAGGRIAPDEELNETLGKSEQEVAEMIQEKEAKARATILEIVGDLPDAEMAPPENVLFVCKLNPVTTDDDLEIIFSRFGKIVCCEVIRDKKSGDSLQYAFIEFDNKKACEDAYFKMDNVLIDDRRIHVDFSQSVSKIKWQGKGRGVIITDADGNARNNFPKKAFNNDDNFHDHKNNDVYPQRRGGMEEKHENYRRNDKHSNHRQNYHDSRSNRDRNTHNANDDNSKYEGQRIERRRSKETNISSSTAKKSDRPRERERSPARPRDRERTPDKSRGRESARSTGRDTDRPREEDRMRGRDSEKSRDVNSDRIRVKDYGRSRNADRSNRQDPDRSRDGDRSSHRQKEQEVSSDRNRERKKSPVKSRKQERSPDITREKQRSPNRQRETPQNLESHRSSEYRKATSRESSVDRNGSKINNTDKNDRSMREVKDHSHYSKGSENNYRGNLPKHDKKESWNNTHRSKESNDIATDCALEKSIDSVRHSKKTSQNDAQSSQIDYKKNLLNKKRKDSSEAEEIVKDEPAKKKKKSSDDKEKISRKNKQPKSPDSSDESGDSEDSPQKGKSRKTAKKKRSAPKKKQDSSSSSSDSSSSESSESSDDSSDSSSESDRKKKKSKRSKRSKKVVKKKRSKKDSSSSSSSDSSSSSSVDSSSSSDSSDSGHERSRKKSKNKKSVREKLVKKKTKK